MAIDQRTIGSGVVGVSAGAVTAELGQQAAEHGVASRSAVRLGMGGVSAAAFGMAGLNLAAHNHFTPIPTSLLIGYGTGVATWTAGREAGVFPGVTLAPPQEISLTAPLFSALIFSGLAITANRLLP